MPAYNNYFPATYQPFGQNYYQQQQQVQQHQFQQSGIIWVGSDSEADAYPIAPNNAVTLWNRSLPIVYFKQADASGRPSMRIYDLVEHKVAQNETEQKQNNNTDDFATKDEVKNLESVVQSIRTEIKAIKKELKKKEEAEDDE